MEKSDVYSEIAKIHSDHPQRGTLAKLALDSIYDGIAELAKLGHVVVLSFSELPTPVEWPKWQYRDDVPGGRLFEDPLELAEAGDGWRDTPLAPVEVTPEPEVEAEPDPVPPVVTVSVPDPVPVPDVLAPAPSPSPVSVLDPTQAPAAS